MPPALIDDHAARELQIALEEMRGTDYDKNDGLMNAFALVQAGGVTPSPNGTYAVKGRTKPYIVSETCPCEDATKRKNTHCYHKAAVQLYKNWRLRLGVSPMTKLAEPTLSLGPSTIDERLAETPQDASQASRAPQGSPDTPVPHNGSPAFVEADKGPFRLPLPFGRTLRPLHAILADLRKPLPDHCIPSFKGPRNTEIDYLSWRQVTHLLHTYAPGWYPEIVEMLDMAMFTLRLRLVLVSAEGRTAYEGVGRVDATTPNTQYGGPAKQAYALALKHAAQAMGMDWLQEENEPNQSLAALDKYLEEQQAARVKTLGDACVQAELDKHAYIVALMQQACVASWKHVPVAMLLEAIQCVDAYAASRKEQ